MSEKDAVALLHKIHGSHARAALSIGYTPEYYTTLRTALKRGKAIPSSARSRIVLEAMIINAATEILPRKREAANV